MDSKKKKIIIYVSAVVIAVAIITAAVITGSGDTYTGENLSIKIKGSGKAHLTVTLMGDFPDDSELVCNPPQLFDYFTEENGNLVSHYTDMVQIEEHSKKDGKVVYYVDSLLYGFGDIEFAFYKDGIRQSAAYISISVDDNLNFQDVTAYFDEYVEYEECFIAETYWAVTSQFDNGLRLVIATNPEKCFISEYDTEIVSYANIEVNDSDYPGMLEMNLEVNSSGTFYLTYANLEDEKDIVIGIESIQRKDGSFALSIFDSWLEDFEDLDSESEAEAVTEEMELYLRGEGPEPECAQPITDEYGNYVDPSELLSEELRGLTEEELEALDQQAANANN